MRTALVKRTTHETDIAVEVNLDGTGTYRVSTGIGFLDHMLEQLSRHSLIDLEATVKGDLHVDQHHTTEDSAIAIGEAISQALGDRRGITRFGSAFAPMDETLTRVALDISGRPFLVWKAQFTTPRLGEMDTELFQHWFHAFAGSAGITLHVENLYGELLQRVGPRAEASHRDRSAQSGQRAFHQGNAGRGEGRPWLSASR